ncbi:unnamed protein product [marine sediment metagenome]|uniref:Uncharacterized protein n=1 Tax=marine sediment metagenome TaxID=412755 RepID=X1GK69_9ZZZZ
MILKKYKNQLLTIIQEHRFETSLFTAENGPIGDDNYFIMGLRDSPLRFAVKPYQGSLDSFLYRSSEFRADFPMSSSDHYADEGMLTTYFKSWLDDVVQPYLDNVNTPDLWHILEETRSRTKSELGTPEDFGPFSDEEKTHIRLSLNEFRLLITQNFNPNQEELKTVDARLQYLSDAIDKHNKFDWKGIAISTVISITIALSLNPEQGNQLFQLFKQIFSNILYLLP